MEIVDESSDLVEQARGGSQAAFTALVRRHEAGVRLFLARYLRSMQSVDDLAQEVFLAAYGGLDSYEAAASFHSWLIGIARNKARAHLRSEIRRRRRDKQFFDEALAQWQAAKLDDQLMQGDQHDRSIAALRGCIERLPARSRSVIEQYYFRKQAAEEIARAMNKNSGAVRMMLLRIRRSLGKCVAAQLIERES